jgi:hypothetical protein
MYKKKIPPPQNCVPATKSRCARYLKGMIESSRSKAF